jgi:hypothetical protein
LPHQEHEGAAHVLLDLEIVGTFAGFEIQLSKADALDLVDPLHNLAEQLLPSEPQRQNRPRNWTGDRGRSVFNVQCGGLVED